MMIKYKKRKSMKIAINGLSGFVGGYISKFLASKGHEIVPIKRVLYDDTQRLKEAIEGADVIINLAGANISKKWSEEYKKELYSSRIDTTKNLVKAMSLLKNPPKIFISTSAVGIYKSGEEHDESSDRYDEGFLGRLAKEWENEANKAKEFGVKTAIFRLSVVLGSGGALEKMLPIFKFGLGGILGDGKQGFSWIAINDLARAYEFVINSQKEGIYNLSSPNPVTNKIFTASLAKALNRPAFFKVPNFALKLKFGEGAVILLEGQKVYPANLLAQEFKFEHENISEALENLIC